MVLDLGFDFEFASRYKQGTIEASQDATQVTMASLFVDGRVEIKVMQFLLFESTHQSWCHCRHCPQIGMPAVARSGQTPS